MFKLVVIPQDDGTLYVNTLDAFYAEGGIYDLSNYVDYESIEVERGNILNEISLKFQEPTTIAALKFLEDEGIAYGDEEAFLEDEDGEPLDGDTLEVELPFEQFIYDRLIDQVDSLPSNTQYSAIVDESLNPVNPKPHIFYNINTDIGTKILGFRDENENKSPLTTTINTPSHVNSREVVNYSTVFGSEYDEFTGLKIDNTLYANHYQTYVESIFNVKKRTFKYSAILPLRIITKLELNDIVKIKNDYYRIDKFTTNLTTGETKLELVNSFDNTFNVFSASKTFIATDYSAKTETVTVTNLSGAVIALVDTGSGTAWVTPTTSGNILSLAVSANSLTAFRSAQVTVTQGTQVLTINITQTDQQYVPKADFSDYRNSNYASNQISLKAGNDNKGDAVL